MNIYFFLFCAPLFFISALIFGNMMRCANEAWGTKEWSGSSSYNNWTFVKMAMIIACWWVERAIEDSLGISPHNETRNWIFVILMLLGSVAGYFIKRRVDISNKEIRNWIQKIQGLISFEDQTSKNPDARRVAHQV